MRLLRQSTGQLITLDTAAPLGSGGEARIYAVREEPTLAAKVYRQPTAEQARKLRAMLANPPEDPAQGAGRVAIAWTTDLLLTPDRAQSVVGFLMPRVEGRSPIFHFYNPSTRRLEHPLSNYFYLHRTARNLAAAVCALHQRGYVIGDVNESNILVTETALVTLVDADSFQTRDAETGIVYRCPVGKIEFTPPELLGNAFSDFDRAPEHDLFGLGVLFFQILMEGTHPFAGVYQGSGDPPPYEVRIGSGHLPYGSRSVPYRPMPAAPPFSLLHPPLQRLFLRCFEAGHTNPAARPTADTWRDAFAEAEEALQTCATNAQHRYGRHLAECPWCERTQQLGGRDPFPSQGAVRLGEHKRRPPRKAPPPPERTPRQPSPSAAPSASGAPASAASSAWAYSAPPPGAPSAPPVSLPSNWAAYLSLLVGCIAVLPGFRLLGGLAAFALGAFGWRVALKSGGGGIGSATVGAALGAVALSLPFLFPAPRGVLQEVGRISAVAFSPDGKTLAVGTRKANDPGASGGTVSLWSVASEAQTGQIPGYRGDVTALAHSPDGRFLAVGSWGSLEPGNVEVRRVANGLTLWGRTAHKNTIRAVAFSPDSSLLATGGSYEYVRTREIFGEIRIWNAETGALQRTIADQGEVFAVAFSPDGKRLAVGMGSSGSGMSSRTGEPGSVRVYEVATGAALWSKRSHGTEALCVAFSPDGKTVASSGYGGTIRFWEATTGEVTKTLENEQGLRIASFAFSPDGATLASGSDDASVTIWEVATGKTQKRLSGHTAEVASVAFSSDGKTVASGGADGAARLWRLRP